MSSSRSPSRIIPLPRNSATGGSGDDASDTISAVNPTASTTLPSGYSGRFPSINRTLARHLRDATVDGELSIDKLIESATIYYDQVDEERRGIVRSMQLMSDEAQELTRELREQTASQLQAILDHVKDVILTVDASGYIESFNPTGERVFG